MTMNFNKQNGFTLVELIAVVVVIGIIAAVVGISIGQADQDTREVNAAHAILSDIRYTQEYAMASRREARFALTSSGYSAVWTDDGSYIRRSSLSTSQQINVDYTTSGDFSGVTISAGSAATVVYDASGAPSIGGSLLVSGTDLTVATVGSSLSIKIVPGTGFTYISSA